MKLKDYIFGFADAAKELSIQPEIFVSAFYDSRNILYRLQNEWRYILIGRKGVGKSAYSAKLQSLNNDTDDFISYPISLDDFEYSTFSKTSIDDKTLGTQKYFDSWNFLILQFVIKILYNDQGMSEVESLSYIVALLETFGFPVTDTFKKSVTKVSKLKIGANAGVFDAAFETEFGNRPINYAEKLTTLIEKMKESLSTIHFHSKIFILIDGVDDILRLKKNRKDILSSLIRSVDSLNYHFYNKKIPIKVILFIREDIIDDLTDPDLNKIKRDGQISLTWVDNVEDLKEIVELRFHLNESLNNVTEGWYNVFPKQISNTDSWEYLLEHTLYKPRDVLQFLTTCQDKYPNKERLSPRDMQKALETYSIEYFIPEMKNELTGFFDDTLINILPAVFQKIGSRCFKLTDMLNIINEQSFESNEYTPSNIKPLLNALFQEGYVGQAISKFNSDNPKRKQIIFKHLNPSFTVDFSQEFILHKGLYVS